MKSVCVKCFPRCGEHQCEKDVYSLKTILTRNHSPPAFFIRGEGPGITTTAEIKLNLNLRFSLTRKTDQIRF